MRKEEFEKAMLELGANKCGDGYMLFVETMEGSVEYFYNTIKEKFTITVDVCGKEEEMEFDILSLHHKDKIIACGIILYGNVMFEYGSKYKLNQIKQALELQ